MQHVPLFLVFTGKANWQNLQSVQKEVLMDNPSNTTLSSYDTMYSGLDDLRKLTLGNKEVSHESSFS